MQKNTTRLAEACRQVEGLEEATIIALADENDALRAERDRLRTILQRITDLWDSTWPAGEVVDGLGSLIIDALAALRETTGRTDDDQ